MRRTNWQLILTVILSAAFIASNVAAQDEEEKRPLNLSAVEKALRSTKTTAANKNALLVEGVETRKITFWLTADNEKKLRSWGANNALLEAIRRNQMPMYSMIQKDMKLNRPVEVKNSMGMELVLIPAGEFMMGLENPEEMLTPNGTRNVSLGLKPRLIRIKQDFYIGRYEVTEREWKLVMGNNPNGVSECAECPVATVTWQEAQAFVKKLNDKADGYRYRLPSEAEWEYAARATTTTKYYWGADPDKKNWQFYAHYGYDSPVKVGSYLPNAFGLYDMSGNVWEMCEDYHYYGDFKDDDDRSQANAELGKPDTRIVRGGDWQKNFDDLRTSRRGYIHLGDKYSNYGFRVAATYIDPATEPKTITDDDLNGKAITALESASGIKGEVRIAVFVDENGKVKTAKFVSGHPLLTEKALMMAKEAKFREMKVDGKPVRVNGVLIYTFK